jgi:hypothetical protein
MLSPIPTATLSQLRSLAVKMEKILLMALEGYGNTFVEPKVELGARFGHLVCECLIISRNFHTFIDDCFQCATWISTKSPKLSTLSSRTRSNWQKCAALGTRLISSLFAISLLSFAIAVMKIWFSCWKANLKPYWLPFLKAVNL